MNGRRMTSLRKTLSLCAVFAGLALPSRGTIWTLTDLNSSAKVIDNAQAGMFQWNVDGVNNLGQQWFWYRIGSSGGQSSIDTISAPTSSMSDARHLSTMYENQNFSISLTYTLTGSTAGSGQSTIGESIDIHNLTATPLDFHFFQYSDYDLNGGPSGDVAQLSKNGQGLFSEADQSKGNVTMSENTIVPGANHGEAALFNQILLGLNGGAPYQLNDNAGPVGPGDATWAFEWDKSIAGGGDLLISKNKQIMPIVPEPGALALGCLGLLAVLFRKRA
jgi:hypothetical protein